MGVREVASRVRYGGRLAIEQATLAMHRHPGTRALADTLLPEITSHDGWSDRLLQTHRAARSRFSAALEDPDATRRLVATHYRPQRDAARTHAEAAANHVFSFFGRRFHYGAEIDWNADPVTGAAWPRVYHAQVPIHHGDRGYGDVKYVWELNRQQFLIDLGKSYFLDGVSEHAAEARRLVAHWRQHNPYGVGVNWSCALEPAFRALSWLWAYHFSVDDPALTVSEHDAWLKGFYEHGAFLSRHLEYYSSPYNHLIGEATVLYLLGVIFREFRDAASWRRLGADVLESRIATEFHRDGGSVEQSTFYHHATLGFYLLALIVGRRNGDAWSPAVLQTVERAIAMSMHMAMPDGRMPAIGGADDGKPIRLEHLPFWDFRPYQAIGAVLFGRPDFKYTAGRFYEDALWLLGPDGRERFDSLPSSPPTDRSHALRSSGYFILRTDWSPRADYVCVDCGEQAAGLRTDTVPSAAHGHADCLSVIAALAGTPVLVDPGFFTYNGPPAWEVHFRKTRAHNTATIDGRDQARHVGKMHWCEVARPQLEHWSFDERQASVGGSHDGFARTPDGVTHRRTVWLRPGGYLLIYDQFLGAGAHDLTLNFQFAPGPAKLAGDQAVTLESGFELWWSASHPLRASLAAGQEDDPDGGWVAASLGVRLAAPRLKLSTRIDGNAAVLTVLTDVGTSSRPWRSHVAAQTWHGGGRLEAAIVGANFVDWVQAPGGDYAQSGMFNSDAQLAVWRATSGGRLLEQARIGGRTMSAAPDAARWLASFRRGTHPRSPRHLTREELS
jgi:hypothetical protein